MEPTALLVAFLAVASLAACISGRVTLDVVGILLLAVLIGSGIVDARTALSGFANSTVLTLAGLYVIGEALTRTGALEFVAVAATRASKGSELKLKLLLCLCAAGLSAVVSDTAVTLVFIPLAIGIAKDRRMPVSRLLMPIAFSTLLGGTVTLVGSSTNLLTSGAAENAGVEPFGFFEMTPIALPLALVGVVVMVLLSTVLLRDRASLTDTLSSAPAREYVTELVLSSRSPLIGQRVPAAFQATGVRILFVVRGENMVWPPLDEFVLQAGDVVMLQGDVAQLVGLQSQLDLKMVNEARFNPKTMTYFELAVAPHSHIVGRRIGDLPLVREYGVFVVALLRARHHIRERASGMALRPGDLLLVCGDQDAQSKLQASTDFFLITGAQEHVIHKSLALRALLVLLLVVGAFITVPALGIDQALPLPVVTMLGALVMVCTGCLTARRAYRAIDFSILVFVVGALALGRAMENTGLAKVCADEVVLLLSRWGPLAVVSGILLVGTLLNQFTSPYAIATLLTPVALEAGRELGVQDLRPFVLAVAFAGSNAFMTPMGHQVNLMVLGPGGYRYGDFLRLGLPMALFLWIFVTVGFGLTAQW